MTRTKWVRNLSFWGEFYIVACDEIYSKNCVAGNRAGVIGLYTALLLSEKGKGREITVIAQHLPGDYSVNYTSPWAGGNFSCVSGSDEKSLYYDKYSYLNLSAIFEKFGEEAGLKRLPARELWGRPPPEEKLKSLKTYIPDVSDDHVNC